MLVDADVHLDVTLEELVPFMDQPWRLQIERAPRSLEPRRRGRGHCRRTNPASSGTAAGIRVHRCVPTSRSSFQPVDLFRPDAEPVRRSGGGHRLRPLGHPDLLPSTLKPASCSTCPSAILRPVKGWWPNSGSTREWLGPSSPVPAFLRYTTTAIVDLYAELQERDLTLGFHPTSVWLERPHGDL